MRFKSRDRFEIKEGENVGRRLDALLVFDIDAARLPDGVSIEGAASTLRGMGVPIEQCPRVRTGSGGEHVYLRLPEGAPNLRAKVLPWIDIKAGPGAYVVAPGSTHPNGRPYEPLNDVAPEQAPAVPRTLLRMIERPAAEFSESPPGALNADQLAAALQALEVGEFREHDRWLELMMACRHACPEGVHEFVSWSTADPLYAHEAESIAKRWHSVDPFVEGGITTATLYQRLIDASRRSPDDDAPRVAMAVIDFAPVAAEDANDAAMKEPARDNGFPLLTADDLLSLSPPEWLVERTLPCGSLGVLYGPPKSAKTFLAINIALSVASQRPTVHGLACRGGRVLYVLGEGGGPMMKDRVWAWIRANDAKVGKNFVLHPRAVNLADPRAVDALLEHAGELWDLVVFDTLARCMDGDENAVKDMHAAIRGCDHVRERTGAAVLLVHHSGKDQTKGMRGSTALLGAVDSVLKMTVEGTRQYVFTVEELRHGEPPEPRRLKLQPWAESAVLVDGSDAAADFGAEFRLLELATTLDDGSPRSRLTELLARELRVSGSTAKRQISDCIPLGRDRAVEAPNGERVWREPDESSGPRAERIRHAP